MDGGRLPPVSVGGPFTLIDQYGARAKPRDFRGKLMLLYFGYTFCPDACPTTLMAMSQRASTCWARQGRRRCTPIFITVDPARDTPAQMKLYASNFHAAAGGAHRHAGRDRPSRRQANIASIIEKVEPQARQATIISWITPRSSI